MLSTFSFIANFRGGTYCTQVKARDIESAPLAWLDQLKLERKEIKHLGDKTISELSSEINQPDNKPAPLSGLENIWFALYFTNKGLFHVNIVRTHT